MTATDLEAGYAPDRVLSLTLDEASFMALPVPFPRVDCPSALSALRRLKIGMVDALEWVLGL